MILKRKYRTVNDENEKLETNVNSGNINTLKTNSA